MGIFAQGSSIYGEDLLIFNCGTHLLNLNIGGKYEFNHSTFANFWSLTTRQTASVVLNSYYYTISEETEDEELVSRELNATFANCIIDGYNENEILFDQSPDKENLTYTLKHCLLKSSSDYWDQWQNQESEANILSEGINFVDYEIFDFELDSNSLAIDAGIVFESEMFELKDDGDLNEDLNGFPRDDNPDIGCFEYH